MSVRLRLFSLLVAFVGVASAARADVKFRMPLSTSGCAGRCSVSAHYDTNRGPGTVDYGCGLKTYAQHDGTDMAIGGFGVMDQGIPVLAAASGTVIAAHDGEFDRCTTANCGTANYVMVRHADGKVTWYWHLKKWSVRVSVGQYVRCGEQLGLVGSSGLSTGPHLHFAVQDPTYGIDDPFRSSAGCGGGLSWWAHQRAYPALPGDGCMAGDDVAPSAGFCSGKANGKWCDGGSVVTCSGGTVAARSQCEFGCETRPTGVDDRCFALGAGIAGKYRQLGGLSSFLGRPRTSEAATLAPGGRFAELERGLIVWSPSTGSHEVHGAIRRRWQETGGTAGSLGFPISDEYDVPGGRRSDFQRGSITWTRATGAIHVRMN